MSEKSTSEIIAAVRAQTPDGEMKEYDWKTLATELLYDDEKEDGGNVYQGYVTLVGERARPYQQLFEKLYRDSWGSLDQQLRQANEEADKLFEATVKELTDLSRRTLFKSPDLHKDLGDTRDLSYDIRKNDHWARKAFDQLETRIEAFTDEWYAARTQIYKQHASAIFNIEHKLERVIEDFYASLRSNEEYKKLVHEYNEEMLTELMLLAKRKSSLFKSTDFGKALREFWDKTLHYLFPGKSS